MQTERVVDHIVQWLRNYIEQSRLEGFVVGVSGGIDSAVTSTLCAKTNQPVCLLHMPIFQAEYQVSLSDKHIHWLKSAYPNVNGLKIDLTSAFEVLTKTFPSEIRDELTMANTRARLRMLTLYAVASHHNMLVAGTGNKIEDFGVGFFTKYGDGGVDISPIADLTKSDVYVVGRTLGIIEEILTAPPTDGLWPDNRSDESQMGATYPELEWAMEFENKQSMEDQLHERQKEVLSIYRGFRRRNRHKMKPVPVCRIPDSLK